MHVKNISVYAVMSYKNYHNYQFLTCVSSIFVNIQAMIMTKKVL